jgi:hypothetical protein
MMDDLDDSLDDLLGGHVVGPAKAPPANYKPMDYSEPCKKCGGSGRFRNLGQCFACKGKGKLEFKTSPQQRSTGRISYQKKKADKAVASVESFKVEHPDVWAWMDGSTFSFAVSLRDSLAKYGSLTENQLAAARRAIEKLAAAKALAVEKRAEREASAPVADTAGVDRLKAAFDHAITAAASKGRGLRMPRITIGDMVISPAKATSKNPGALYVKSHGDYLGKVANGRFYAVAACTPVQQDKILAFIKDPKAAAEAYGIETGVCCVCNATLTNKESIARGIGPICASRFGW